ncbi:Mov34/MPN/PAD-1 family protein [Fuscibacter oryzae]|uniref:Mov34/MPN/PAD-1 family protein n=1 Tax=Fuscibacter oryzae TaxID=2803939 RepID=A0A8J7SWB4_9RHOB|nr:Mov34/MPN/PAD-1 family protein [Fuscibacter oryzae]MBL4929506.1 Mov34/MPN/PAD-1 family protein [Fuscibacter oryzae]
MTFSIKATIRAFVAPDHRLSMPHAMWRVMLAELRRRGGGKTEAGAFLLGRAEGNRRKATSIIYYDQLDPAAYSSGVCVLHGDAFAKLWAYCRDHELTVVADVHTHRGAAHQSGSDRKNPMVAREGHIAIIVPDFAAEPVEQNALGIFEYRGSHMWFDRTVANAKGYFYYGFWA